MARFCEGTVWALSMENVWGSLQGSYAHSSALRASGAKAGSRVGIYGINCPQWTIAMEACSAQSFVCVPLFDTLATGGEDTSVVFFNRTSGEILSTLTGHSKKENLQEHNAKTDLEGTSLTDEKLSVLTFGRKPGYVCGVGCGQKTTSYIKGKRTRAELQKDANKAVKRAEVAEK